MTHLVVGDGHYFGAPDEPARWSALLAAATQAGVTELSILGDFFELWLGLSRLETPWQETLWAPLREMKSRGVKLRYVVGNKDFFVKEWNQRHQLFDAVIEKSVLLESAAGPIHLAHGDLVNHADHQYRAWRAFSRSAPIQLFIKSLPRSYLARLGEKTAAKMQGTNRYHKSYFPEDQLRAHARELPPGPATMIYGHFHAFHELQEGEKKIITLPFLGAENAGVLITSSGIHRFPAA
jgi:UDP-2,3-diacylglucosamine pyrophosphatase LpxH